MPTKACPFSEMANEYVGPFGLVPNPDGLGGFLGRIYADHDNTVIYEKFTDPVLVTEIPNCYNSCPHGASRFESCRLQIAFVTDRPTSVDVHWWHKSVVTAGEVTCKVTKVYLRAGTNVIEWCQLGWSVAGRRLNDYSVPCDVLYDGEERDMGLSFFPSEDDSWRTYEVTQSWRTVPNSSLLAPYYLSPDHRLPPRPLPIYSMQWYSPLPPQVVVVGTWDQPVVDISLHTGVLPLDFCTRFGRPVKPDWRPHWRHVLLPIVDLETEILGYVPPAWLDDDELFGEPPVHYPDDVAMPYVAQASPPSPAADPFHDSEEDDVQDNDGNNLPDVEMLPGLLDSSTSEED
jgi:hypothetical protein